MLSCAGAADLGKRPWGTQHFDDLSLVLLPCHAHQILWHIHTLTQLGSESGAYTPVLVHILKV